MLTRQFSARCVPLGTGAAGSALRVCGASWPCAPSLAATSSAGDTESDSLWPDAAPASAKQEIAALKSKKDKISPSRILCISIILPSFTAVIFHLTLSTMLQITRTSHLKRGLPTEKGAPETPLSLEGYCSIQLCNSKHQQRASTATVGCSGSPKSMATFPQVAAEAG